MNISPELAVRELVIHNPVLATVLEQYQIDYCCGGDRTLGEASNSKKIPIDKLIEELECCLEENGEPEDNWSLLSISELIDHIVSHHHSFLNKELPYIEGLMKKVVDAHSKRHAELVDLNAVFQSLKLELEQHLAKEEQVLFPLSKQLESTGQMPQFHCGNITNPIAVMEHEHEDAGSALKKMREITSGYELPEDACPTYKVLFDSLLRLESDLYMHIHKENNILHHKIRKLHSQISKQN